MNKDERKQNHSILVMRPFYKQRLKNLATFNCSLLFINCKRIRVICYYKIVSSITGRFLSNFYQINKDFQTSVYKICYREVAETRSLCMHICIHVEIRRPRFNSWIGNIPWRRDGLPTPVLFGFPSGSNGKVSTCSMGDVGSIPGSRRSLGGGHGNPLQYSCLENSHGQRSLAGYNL